MILVFMVVAFMNILIIGAPGSGKGVQSHLIQNEYGLVSVVIGDLLRKEMLRNSNVGKKIKNSISQGLLVDDKIVFLLLKKKMRYITGILLDGFPRTLFQASFLDYINFKCDYIIKLNVREAVLIKRIKYRLINNFSNMVYNIIYFKPKIQYKDDVSGAKLFTRIDDTYYIFKVRFQKYISELNLITEYFVNKEIPFIEVDGDNDPLVVFKEIKSRINKYE